MMCQQVRSLDAEISVSREEVELLRRPENRGEAGIDAEPARGETHLLDDEDEIIRG